MIITERKSDGSAGAVFSEDRAHRLILWRRWDGRSEPGIPNGCKLIAWIMCNPSTADASEDDATLRRCISFTKALGYEGLLVVNLWSFRAKDPKELEGKHQRAKTRDTDKYIRKAVSAADRIIAAWGASGPQADRCVEVQELIGRRRKAPLSCLGKTQTGEPKHPLYVKKATPLEPFKGCDHTEGDE